MKQIILGSVLAVVAVTSMSAHAASSTFCAGGSAAASAVTAVSGSASFVKVDFSPKCSANVLLAGDDNSATVFRVGSASTKGKTRFNGSSIGGAVGNAGLCGGTNNACVAGSDEAAALAAAPSS